MELQRLQRAVLACLALGVAACALDESVISQSAPEIVVHSVLDPGVNIQELLLERTLTGAIDINDKARYDSLDPINTAGGIPIAGATVVITGPDGPITLVERAYVGKGASYGQGRYLMSNTGFKPIRPGATYTLAITTKEGSVVSGETTVPAAVTATTTTNLGTFNREQDTLHLSWKPVSRARTYGARVESPFGAFLLFSDSTHLDLAGTMRNFWASDIQRLFIPGFDQVSTISAVDSNYFDYFRSRNDPFTGSGIINHLRGAIGLFGSSVTIDSRMVRVSQPVTNAALEGHYVLTGPPPNGLGLVDNFTLWIETDAGSSASLSGSYVKRPPPVDGSHDGFGGARDGSRIELQFLNNQDIHNTYNRFVGTWSGDSIIGAYTNGTSRVVFRKTP